jgi:2-keto-3-deoxy-L-rhamnonate aldolase RhmA
VQYMDRMADGIVVPHVDTAEEAQAIVEMVRYACGKAANDKIVITQI